MARTWQVVHGRRCGWQRCGSGREGSHFHGVGVGSDRGRRVEVVGPIRQGESCEPSTRPLDQPAAAAELQVAT